MTTTIAPINAAQKHANSKAIVAALTEGLAEARDSFYCGIKASLERQNEETRFKRSAKSIEHMASETADSIIAKYIARAGGKLWDLLSDRDDFGFELHLTPSRGFIEGLIKVDFENGDRLCLDSSGRYQWRYQCGEVIQYPTRISYLKTSKIDTRQITIEDAALALDHSAPEDIQAKIKAGREERAAEEAARLNANHQWDEAVSQAEADHKAAKAKFDRLDYGSLVNDLKAYEKSLKQLEAANGWDDLVAAEFFHFHWQLDHHKEQGTFEDFKANETKRYNELVDSANIVLADLTARNGLQSVAELVAALKQARKDRTAASKAVKAAKSNRQKERYG